MTEPGFEAIAHARSSSLVWDPVILTSLQRAPSPGMQASSLDRLRPQAYSGPFRYEGEFSLHDVVMAHRGCANLAVASFVTARLMRTAFFLTLFIACTPARMFAE